MNNISSKILIIEDNPFDYQFTKRILCNSITNLDVHGADNLVEAFKLLKNNDYDFIFLDLNLPDSKGLDSLDLVLNKAENIPIVILTANDDKETALKALNKGAQDYILKNEIKGSSLERSMRYAFERKQNEVKLKKKNLFLFSILESLTHPFIVVDAESFKIKIANSAAKNLYFYNDIYCFKYYNGLEKPCVSKRNICPVCEVKKSLEPISIVHSYKNKKGMEVINQIYGFPLFDSGKKLSQVIIYYIDISEQEKTKLNYQKLSTVVQQSSDSIFITDIKGQIEYTNPAFEKNTGYKADDVKGKTKNIFHSGKHDDEFYNRIESILKKGNAWEGVMVSKKKNGSFFEEKVKVSPVKDKTGNIANYVTVSRDITKEKRLESIAEAANLMANIGYIFSGIRHEIGNPINSIKLALTVLKNNINGYSKEKILEFVKRSLDEIIRVEYLLKALKNFSMHETPHIRPVLLNDFLKHFVKLIKDDFLKERIIVKAVIPEKELYGNTDPRALHQVLLNLFTNAADALTQTAAPNILVKLKSAESLAVIEVIDNGCGMNSEEQENLFKPFYTSKDYGTGLGLVIVKKMLAKMESTIKIRSKKDHGTKIILIIPESDNGSLS